MTNKLKPFDICIVKITLANCFMIQCIFIFLISETDSEFKDLVKRIRGFIFLPQDSYKLLAINIIRVKVKRLSSQDSLELPTVLYFTDLYIQCHSK